MKKFAFRLQRVLNVREAHEKLRLGELGREQQRLSDEEQRLKLFEGERDYQISETRAGRTQEFSVWSQGINCRYLQRIGQVVDFQAGRVDEQAAAVEQARSRYQEARRDTRVLEMLREKKVEEWKQSVLLEEGNILDDIGSRKPGW